MIRPERIKRRRTKGWRMPAGAVYVGRPTKWGNPWVAVSGVRSSAETVARYRRFLAVRPNLLLAVREELAGKVLACWCRLDKPCHADVLLEVANGFRRTT